jgi:serine/threonine-protein kinase RsbT
VVVQVTARSFATDAGFSTQACWEFAIAASEAATNIIKYGGGGEVRLRTGGDSRVYVEVEARDRGQGIADLARALEDGVSENRTLAEETTLQNRRGLGLGLGSISRMTDELEISRREGGGTVVRARKYLRQKKLRPSGT